jgi:hypothetical protein
MGGSNYYAGQQWKKEAELMGVLPGGILGFQAVILLLLQTVAIIE